MFKKEMKKRIADLETFERGVCTIIDGYFKHNEQAELRYSMDNAVDKFWHFVQSVDNRLNVLSNDVELKAKENEFLKSENEKLQDEIASDNDELASKEEKIEQLEAIIKAQEKEIETLVKAMAKGGKK